jgi:predicted kinase
MQIINPIYDSAFKYLMDNNQVAKLMISAIIGEEIEELVLDATELKVDVAKETPREEKETIAPTFFTILRIDFAARIKSADGSIKEVLIEIQKAKLSTDIMRFRSYLGERYSNENVSVMVNGQRKALPILPIYFLGHPLEHTDATIIKVNRQYIDLVTGEQIHGKEEFIESLTHNSFVIQISKLKQRRRNDLEALLSIFDQDNIASDRHILNIREEDIPEKYRPILRRLLEAVSEKKVRDGMKAEDQVLNEFQTLERIIVQEREEKEKAQKEKEEALNKLKSIIKKHYEKGKSLAEIAADFDLTQEEVKRIIENK